MERKYLNRSTSPSFSKAKFHINEMRSLYKKTYESVIYNPSTYIFSHDQSILHKISWWCYGGYVIEAIRSFQRFMDWVVHHGGG